MRYGLVVIVVGGGGLEFLSLSLELTGLKLGGSRSFWVACSPSFYNPPPLSSTSQPRKEKSAGWTVPKNTQESVDADRVAASRGSGLLPPSPLIFTTIDSKQTQDLALCLKKAPGQKKILPTKITALLDWDKHVRRRIVSPRYSHVHSSSARKREQ